MKTMSPKLKISLIVLVGLFLFGFSAHAADFDGFQGGRSGGGGGGATWPGSAGSGSGTGGTYTPKYTCGARNVIASQAPFWGSDTAGVKNITTTKGSYVSLTIKGEDGCARQLAEFQVLKGTSVVDTLQGYLGVGPAVPGQVGAFWLIGDWPVDLPNGDYKLKLIKIGNAIWSSNPSSNILTVQSTQACNLKSVYPTPNGGKPGDVIKLTVEATGTCKDWKASVTVVDAVNPNNPTVWSGSAQDISSGKAVWNYTLPQLGAGQEQYSYYLAGSLGNQNIKSGSFLVTKTGTNGGGGSPTPTFSAPPTSPRSYSFEIKNPLAGGPNDLFDVINIITKWLLNIAIPLAVIFILWAGFLMITAGSKPAQFDKGKKILTNVVIGLAIIFIGRGFITLIYSVLELGGTGTAPISGTIGSTCTQSASCQNGLTCKNAICQREGGSNEGEPCREGISTDCSGTLVCGLPVKKIGDNNFGTCTRPLCENGFCRNKPGVSCSNDSSVCWE